MSGLKEGGDNRARKRLDDALLGRGHTCRAWPGNTLSTRGCGGSIDTFWSDPLRTRTPQVSPLLKDYARDKASDHVRIR
jgi:hypothetical protein